MAPSENVACFSPVSPTDAKMFADCERRERVGQRGRKKKGRNKERGSKGEWGEAEMDEWKYRRSKVSSSLWRVLGNICTFALTAAR